MQDPAIPPYSAFLWPTLQAVRTIGGSGAIEEIVKQAVATEGFTEAEQAVLHGDGPNTEIAYRLAWARSYLKGMGLLTNSSRGVWSLTDAGRVVEARDIPALHAKYLSDLRRSRVDRRTVPDTTAREPSGADETGDWKDRLLEVLMGMTSDGFERLAQRLLREAGFISARVTGRSGDGGIDGLGVYRPMSLISFPVFFQCKRYRGSVGPKDVRDFRGAMAGRGDKGLLITTGTFTTDAKAEATRDGAPPVDLIDGQGLCDLLKQYGLGVRTVTRQVEVIAPEFFADL